MDPSAIDIIVPVYKSAALTRLCLQSLTAHLTELAAFAPRLIVINDSPGDAETATVLGAFAQRPGVVLLENETNQGFVHTVNRGLHMSAQRAADVILVNADTQTFPDTLKQLVEVAYSDPQIGFVSPRSNNASLCSLPHVHGGLLPTPEQAHADWLRLRRTMPAYHFVPTAVGFYLYIKHLVLANFAPLDTSFGVGYEEENDLILRANKVGYRAALANHAFAFHAGAASFSLTDLPLEAHRAANLRAMTARHPEFLPWVRRYEASAHFRSEALLGHMLPISNGRLKIVFDLSSLACNVNGTSEQSVATLASLCARHGADFDVSVICSRAAFSFHALDRIEVLRRQEAEPLTSERFAIAVRIGQPFAVEALTRLETLAPINLYGMLDTIAEDCGHLSLTHPLEECWGHAARHANGLFFISAFSQSIFLARYPDARRLPRFARLLPTRLADFRLRTAEQPTEHVLIMGNHFAHKASMATAEILRVAFPTLQLAVLGKESASFGNVRSFQSGEVAQETIETLYARASVVVLPSYVEGFGFALVRALAAGKAVVARDIPATREILATYKAFSGVYLFRNSAQLVDALRSAIGAGGSRVDDTGAEGWNEWVDAFAQYCKALPAQDDVFPRMVQRTREADLLRRACAVTSPVRVERQAARHLRELLALEGESFVQVAYASILERDVDSQGLENYLSELQAGVPKLTVISRLRNSDEGRQKARPLPGYRQAVIVRSLLRPLHALIAREAEGERPAG